MKEENGSKLLIYLLNNDFRRWGNELNADVLKNDFLRSGNEWFNEWMTKKFR